MRTYLVTVKNPESGQKTWAMAAGVVSAGMAMAHVQDMMVQQGMMDSIAFLDLLTQDWEAQEVGRNSAMPTILITGEPLVMRTERKPLFR